MSKQIIRVTYLLALVAGGLISFTQPPVRWAGLALLIVAFGLPLVSSTLIPWTVRQDRQRHAQVLVPQLELIPIVGRIAAGKPVPDDDIAGYVATSRVNIDDSEYTIHPLGVGRGNILAFDLESRYFATPVEGDSMDQAGILKGDYVIIRQPRGARPSPDPEDIVAAVVKDIDRESTLKRFKQRGRKIILSPESSNPDHQPYEFTPSEWNEKVEIAGIAIAVLKKVRESPN